MTLFEIAMKILLDKRVEGGYVNDPNDDGGETNFGISKRAFPNVDIKNLTPEKAAQIYLANYWIPCHCDQLPPSVAILVFDSAVNMGVETASKILQESVGVPADGIIGKQTISAANGLCYNRSYDLLNEYMSIRIVRYSRMKKWPLYVTGWMRRIMFVYSQALTVRL